MCRFLELTGTRDKMRRFWINIPMVALDHSVYSQTADEIIGWNEILSK
jgi:hypothetical protein